MIELKKCKNNISSSHFTHYPDTVCKNLVEKFRTKILSFSPPSHPYFLLITASPQLVTGGGYIKYIWMYLHTHLNFN